MTELETRLAALDLAIKSAGEFRTEPSEIVAAAKKFFAFLSGIEPEPKEDLGELVDDFLVKRTPSNVVTISQCDFGKADQTPHFEIIGA